MKNIIPYLLIAFGFVAFSGPLFTPEAFAVGKTVAMKNGCPRPAGTMKKSGGTMIFTLKHGQKGGCPTDRKARHSAPYWERSELRSSNFTKGKKYSFSFEVKFDARTASSNRTAFFQVHQYKKGSCQSCSPAVMLKANANGTINVAYLRAKGGHGVKSLGIKRSQIAGKWTRFTVRMGTSAGNNPIVVSVNGRNKFTGTVFVSARGAIYLKTGLYRPGNKSGLPTDRVSIRNVSYQISK